MSHKDYQAIAAKCHALLTDGTLQVLPCAITAQAVFDEMVVIIADTLQGDNAQFDRDRFFTAVYHGKTGKVKQ